MEEWLETAGLGKWSAAFRGQGITRDQLEALTEADLRELGLPIGERKRFLRALGEYPPTGKASSVAAAAAAASRAERRPLTVMFIDLVDSTQLGERLHAEDLIEVIRRYRELCDAAVVRFGGHVERFMGDGMLAYFCYPVANENDPERAVRASLEIVRGIGSLETPVGAPLRVRIGLATGRVIVSDLVVGGAADPHMVLGSVPNLAARIQGLVPPNGIAMAASTHSRVEALFACDSLGKLDVKGFDQPLELWRVLGERPQRGLSGHRPRPQTGFHGRAHELGLLRILWSEAERGEGKVALVVGDAGIGKSRLVEQLAQAHLPTEARVIRLAASVFDENTPFSPLIDHIRGMAGLSGRESVAEAIRKIDAVLLGGETQRRDSGRILAALAGVSLADLGLGRLQPRELRSRTIAVLAGQMLLLAEQHPVCLVIEDLHWLDPSSREVLESLARQLHDRRMLMLLTMRPDAASDWSARADTTLRLDRFKPAQVTAMLTDLFAGRPVPPQLASEVIQRSDGVPLFVEELGRLLLAGEKPGDQPTAAQSGGEAEIPASLDGLLMARLDRSGLAKEVAQAAAVVGRSVEPAVLAAICSLPAQALEPSLAALVSSGVLEPGEAPTPRSYRFHHALLHEVAYASLVRDRRRDLHARAAQALQEIDPDLIEQHPETLARHLAEGGRAEDAVPHWLEAARRSLSRSALTEATRLLQRGLAALAGLPRTARNLSLTLQISALLGPALISLRGPKAPETQELRDRDRIMRSRPRGELAFPHPLRLVAIVARFPHASCAGRQPLAARRRAPGSGRASAGASLLLGQPSEYGPLRALLRAYRGRISHLSRRRLSASPAPLRQSRRQGLRSRLPVAAALDAGPCVGRLG